jgi:hypothetical protein
MNEEATLSPETKGNGSDAARTGPMIDNQCGLCICRDKQGGV